MALLRLLIFILPLLCFGSQSSDASIRAALAEQVDAWNHTDLTRFVATYAQHCTIIGGSISQVTRAEVLAHYREKYPTPAKMGHLAFSDLNVSILDDRHAIAVARWRVDRGSASGGPTGGVFSLVFEKQSDRWLIILDHTS